jgi:hypothetical protein
MYLKYFFRDKPQGMKKPENGERRIEFQRKTPDKYKDRGR